MIYLAAPLFNPREREYNLYLKNIIPYSMYLPQEDGQLITTLIAGGMPVDSAIRTVYRNDIQALRSCDLMVAVLDGSHVDSGVAFEIGFFSALGKPIVGYHTDNRSELPFGHNPMITGAIVTLVRNESELLATLAQILSRKNNESS